MRVALLLPLVAGCFVVPRTVTKATTEREESAPREEPAGPLRLDVAGAGRALRVRAMRPRTCHRDVIEVTTTTRSKEADLEVPDIGPDSSGYGAAIVLGVSVITLPISGLITASVIHGDKPKTSQARRVVDRTQRACPVWAAAVRVELALPSGAVLIGTTDARGEVVFQVPPSEPPSGDATARAEDVSATLRYDVTR